MRKVIVSEFVSLDGVAENPAWTFQFGSEEQEKYKFDELFACDALLLGRVTYQGFAAAWPDMQGTGEYGKRINSMPKYVASTTLTQMEWNASLITYCYGERKAGLQRREREENTETCRVKDVRFRRRGAFLRASSTMTDREFFPLQVEARALAFT